MMVLFLFYFLIFLVSVLSVKQNYEKKCFLAERFKTKMKIYERWRNVLEKLEL